MSRLIAAQRSARPTFLGEGPVVKRMLEGDGRYPPFHINHLRANDTLQ